MWEREKGRENCHMNMYNGHMDINMYMYRCTCKMQRGREGGR